MKGVKDVDGKPLCVVVLSDYKDFVKSRYVNSKVPRRSRLIKDSNRLKFLSKESSSESDRFDWLEDCIVKDSSLDEENDGRKESSEPRYELKYFGMIRDMDQVAKLRGRRPDWYVISDDDTVWTDQRMLRKQLGRFDPSEPKLIGSFSEGLNQLKQFGTMAYGGAGIIISRSLASKILMIHEECLRDLKDVFGGDEMYSSCAARAIGNGTTKNTVVTNLISLHQMDIPGDATGFFQSGLPFLSLHHLWHSWTIPFGNKEHTTEFKESDLNLNQILLLQKSAKILGFNNFLKRSIYSSGKDLITLGYSITRFKEAIRLEDLEKIENTWSEGYQLRFMTRELIHEVEENSNGKIFEENDEDRNRKRTFYLSEIKRIDDGDDEDERFLLKNYLWIHVDKFGEKVILRFI
ncbi:hypothetical protein PPACK8108_LOCUS4941 [Phakopsora pachyrhizi]|uniref:Glycosyltransferase family 31 protein n=1 Tax=Phakopsora pachyrhizi TaxID=170000 RepID=A0AAV0AQL0_PHAPC|nr:hypothetical protein PPACK8108_LOCUS4941 [Phakopsora pachyrhizi]